VAGSSGAGVESPGVSNVAGSSGAVVESPRVLQVVKSRAALSDVPPLEFAGGLEAVQRISITCCAVDCLLSQ